MKKLCILFVMLCSLAFGQAPLTVFGDLNVGGGHLNPGVGVALPLTSTTSLPVEVNRTPNSTVLTVGIKHQFVQIHRDGISGIFDLGGAFGKQARFVHEYGAFYDKWINRKWSASPYVKYSITDGKGGWAGGLAVSFRWYR
jgi:hypothetical protein